MSHTSREPSTKVFGPCYPFMTPPPASRVILQLHNLEPGEFWDPALEADLLAPKTLLPIAIPAQWRIINATWNIRVRWTLDYNTLLWVRRAGTFPYAFLFNFTFATNAWVMNELTSAPGNFAYNGSATLSWTGL